MTTDLRRRLLRDIGWSELLKAGRWVDPGVADAQSTLSVR
jgi:hypothetical protein